MARPRAFTEYSKIRVSPSGQSKLQKGSDRRAIVDFMIEAGGVATLPEIERHFHTPVRDKVSALIRAGWLEVVKDE